MKRLINLLFGPQHRVYHHRAMFTYFTFRGRVPRVGDFLLPSDEPTHLLVKDVSWHQNKDGSVSAWVAVG